MMMVERHDQLRVLTELYADCVGSKGQVALISGSVASGKTELLSTFADWSRREGALLLTATGSRAERKAHFGLLRQLLQSPGLPTSIVDRAIRSLSGEDLSVVTHPAWTAVDPTANRSPSGRTLDELCATLLELARDRPVVIAVDDVRFADGPSLQALLCLQRRMRHTHVLMVYTDWAIPRSTQTAFRAELTRHPNNTHLPLSPLSVDGVAELLGTRLDATTASALAPVYHAVSGGNPLLVNALIRDYNAAVQVTGGLRDGEIPVGREFGQAVLSCLHRWEPAILDVARGVALLEDAAGAALLGRLLDISSDSAAQALDVLEMAGLLDGGRFRHAVAKAAVVDNLGPAERAGLHVRAAKLLYRDSATEVAGHLVAADHVDGAWAVGVLRQAAQEALVDHRTEDAIRHLELAARGCADDVERADITAELLRVEWGRNPLAAARYISPLRAARTSGHLSQRNTVQLAKYLAWYGDTKDLSDTLTGLAAADSSPMSSRLSMVFRLLTFLYPAAADGISVPQLSAAPMMSDSEWARGSLLLDLVRQGGPNGEIVTTAEHILQIVRLGKQNLCLQVAAVTALLHADCNDRAAYWCESLQAVARAQGALTWQAVIGALGAEVALRLGDLPAAAEQAHTAHDRLSIQGWGVVIGLPLAVHVTAATALGEHERAAALLRQPVPEAMFSTQFGVQYLHARGLHYLATGRPHAALGDFLHCRERMLGWVLDRPTLAPWRTSAARAHIALGNHDTAAALLREELGRPGHGPRTRGMCLRTLAAASPADQRVALLREAVDLLRSSKDRYELSGALVDLGDAYRGAGDPDNARAAGLMAMQAAKGTQAEPLSRQLVAAPAGTSVPTPGLPGGDPAGIDALSDAERRVAILAARGHTNRKISATLFITVSTVEQHLTRVYRKLNVTSRSDLSTGLPQQLLTGVDGR